MQHKGSAPQEGAAGREGAPGQQRPRRLYHAPRRAKAAADTREAILDAATRLFLARGYANVTVADIAQEAGVAVPTVYASTGGKGAVLTTLIEQGLRSSAAEETLAAVRATAVPREILAAAAHGTRLDNERHHRLVRVMVNAAHTDEHAATALAHADRAYREALAAVTQRLRELHALRPTLPPTRATDILTYHLGHRSWHELVIERGWPWPTTEHWLTTQLTTALLPEPDGEPAGE